MKLIDDFVDGIFTNVSGKEASELKEEMRTHLMEAVSELKSEGKSEEEAIRIALERFGDKKLITTGLFQLFRFQKNFTKKMYRIALISLLIAVLSFIGIGTLNSIYRDSYSKTMNNILNIVSNDNSISSNEVKQINKQIDAFNNKYGTLRYIGVYYNEVPKTGDPFHNLNEAKYLYPKNAKLVQSLGIAGVGQDTSKWYVEAQYDDQYRDKYDMIPIVFLVISGVLLMVWIFSRNNNQKQMKGYFS